VNYPPEEDPRLFYLKDFQSRRLRSDYADLAELPDYEAACHFFFHRLYTTEDTSDRDESFRKIHRRTKQFLGGDIASSMARLIELQELTIALDHKLLAVLADLNSPLDFDEATYERAYRESDNYADRLLQIELLVFTNRLIHHISHRFGIGMALGALRTACLVLGDTRMVDFLMDGYKAFKNLKDITPLVTAIETRETRRLDRIYAR